MPVTQQVLNVLQRVTGTDEVQRNPDLALYDLQILDSLATVELMLALSDEFGIDIAPAEVEREQWSSPARIVAYMEQRLAA